MISEGLMNYEEKFNRCFTEFSERITKFICSYVHDWETAEDLLQEVYIKLFEKKETVDPSSSTVFSYLMTTAKHGAFDYMKGSRKAPEDFIEVDLEEVTMDCGFYRDIEDIHVEGEILSTLHDTIDSFPARGKKLLLDTVFFGRTKKDIAEENGISLYKLRKIESDVHGKIKKALRHYFDSDGFSD